MPLVPARQWLIGELICNGLWPEEARCVFDTRCKPEITSMSGRWDEDVHNFSGAERCRVRLLAFGHVLQWMDANKPDHMARANFKMAVI
jgi:hypothetical protein